MAGKIKKLVDWNHLNTLCRYDASLNVCAQTLGMSHDSLEKQIKKEHGCTFGEYKSRQLDFTILKLKEKMISKAANGDNTCLIFSLKNLARWSDRVEHGFDEDKGAVVLKYSLANEKSKRAGDDSESGS